MEWNKWKKSTIIQLFWVIESQFRTWIFQMRLKHILFHCIWKKHFLSYLSSGGEERKIWQENEAKAWPKKCYLFLTIFSLFRYLSCVSQTMKKLQPFGDVPRKLTEQLRRSFVASRTFAQALLEGKQIINKISKVRQRVI